MKKKPDNRSKDLRSPEAISNEIMETITTNENNTDSKESTCKQSNKEDLMNLF